MTKKELRLYVEMRLRELQSCKEVGEPTYKMAAINARIDELNSLLTMFGKEN